MSRPDGVTAARTAEATPTVTGFGAVPEVWAQRRGARTRVDLAYLVYLVVLTLAVLGAPAARLAALMLDRPDVLVLLTDPAAPAAMVALTMLTAVLALGLGAARGPAVLSRFFTATLASGPMPRRRALLRPYLRALLGPLALLGAVAALLATTLWTAQVATVASACAMVLAALGGALLIHVCWLAGELLDARGRRLAVLALLVLGAALTVLPPGVGPAAVHPGGSGPAMVWALGLLGAGVLAVLASVPALDRLRGSVLMAQAERWEAAATMAGSGDLTGAHGAFRALPTTGRRLTAVGPGPLPLLYLRRDAVAWLRTPERFGLAVLAASVGAAALLLPALIAGPLGWIGVGLGALLLWSASGALTDGIRHAVATLGAPALFGQGVRGQILLHSLAPTILLALVALPASVIAALATGTIQGVGTTLWLAPAMIGLLVLARAWAAAKGPMPLKLAAPMPTPQGDASVVPQLMWHSDWLWVVLAIVLLPVAIGQALGMSAAVIALLVLTGTLLTMTEARLRRLRS